MYSNEMRVGTNNVSMFYYMHTYMFYYVASAERDTGELLAVQGAHPLHGCRMWV